MRSIDVYAFYTLGQELARIKELPDEVEVYKIVMINFAVRDKLEALLRGEIVELGVALEPANGLRNSINDVVNAHCWENDEWKWPSHDLKTRSYEASRLRNALQRFEHVLAAETKLSAVYHASKKCIFSTQDLVERGGAVFSDDLRPFIADMALEEYQAAGRALAFDLATASAFHVGRAVEAMLREYRTCFLTGENEAGMGATVNKLKKYAESKPTPCPSEKTLRQLGEFVYLDRNPIMHPEDVLTIDQALICFFNGISAVTAMALEIKALKGDVKQGLLPMGGLTHLQIVKPPSTAEAEAVKE